VAKDNGLLNEGFAILGEPVNSNSTPCIVIVGTNRGGTSAIAASMAAIGFHLGDRSSEPNFEDAFLANAIRKKDWRGLKSLVTAYRSKHLLFAWKFPGVIRHLFRVHRLLDRPRYIFVYRDVFAISNRKHQVFDGNHANLMLHSLWDYARIVLFIRMVNPYALHVSYEKLLYNKEAYAKSLLKFCGMEETEELIDNINRSISVSPTSYVEWTQRGRHQQELVAVGYKGLLEGLSEGAVVGWAFKLGSERAVALDIYVNGSLVGDTTADIYNNRITEVAGVTRNGHIAFEYKFTGFALSPGDIVSVKIQGTQYDLVDSPKSFS
jgi:hypothetical protein